MNKPIHESVQQAVQKAWTDAVAALQTVEEEVGRRVRQAMERADLPQSGEDVQRVLADFGRKLQQNKEAVSQRLEESMRVVQARLREPLLEEIQLLRSKAEELGQRIENRLRRQPGAGPADGGDPSSR